MMNLYIHPDMDTNSVTAMYDTIQFTLFRDDYPHVDFLKEIPPVLTQIENQGESKTGYFINGYIDNYKVSINSWRVKFQDASIAKYNNGDNVQGMSLQGTRDAITKLSDQLRLDISRAKVTRVDVGRNIIMKLPPSIYFSYLGEHPRYKRLEMVSGLIYKNSGRELAFYDKAKEQRQKRHDLPSLFKDRNILRYEIRYKNHLERELRVDRLTIKHLTDEKFYIEIIKRWKQEYFGIRKLSSKSSKVGATTSTRELMLNLALITINDIGPDLLIKEIGLWQQQGLIGKKQASDHRKAIRDAIQRDFKARGNERIEELDRKIKEGARFYI